MPHPVVHFEFWSPDPGRATAFYQEVFGWKIQHAPELNYWPIDTESGSTGINGGMFKPQEGQLPAKLSVYIQVDDVQAALDRAEAAGAKTIVPPMEIPGIGWSAIFLDPEERAIGVYKPLEPAE